MARKVVIIGGGAAGIGAAGAAKATDQHNDVLVYTQFQDVGYSPCGIPYVHGKEIPEFQALFLADKQTYADAGIDIRYETAVASFDPAAKTVQVEGEGEVSYDSLIVATGFDYKDPGVPGSDLGGLYYVKNIREAMEWDKVLDTVERAVVVEASALGLEMVTALAHRGIDTHVIDPHPWALGELCDPDIAAPVQESWAEMGVTMHWNTTLTGFLGRRWWAGARSDHVRRRDTGRAGRHRHAQGSQQRGGRGRRTHGRFDRRRSSSTTTCAPPPRTCGRPATYARCPMASAVCRCRA